MAGNSALAKLAAARTRLVLERPLLGALAIHLPLVAASHCRSTATDARAFYFNPGFIDALDFAETQFMLAHEALHCALGHHRRRGTRLATRWNIACDYAVNQLLVDDGLRAPLPALVDPRFRGLAAEAIYPLLEASPAEATLDEHWFGAGDSAQRMPVAPPRHRDDEGADGAASAWHTLHADGIDELAARAPAGASPRDDSADRDDWTHRLAASALEAQASGRLGAHWRALLPEFIQARLPWRALLARYLMALAREDFSFARPNRRAGEVLLPGLASEGLELVVALDTSGSIDPRELADFALELDALKGQLRARITLLACDAALDPAAPWYFEAWEAVGIPDDLAGGGSTRFTPVFDWIANQGVRPHALLYFTDAQGEFPAHAPDFPVLWLVKGNAPVPWGERVQLN